MKPHLMPLRVLQNHAGWVPRPSWCTYLVCNRCNARCSMCDSWQIPRGYEMSPREVKRVFAKVGSLDVVRLSGGEPFLRSDLLDVAEAILEQSRPFILHITTNGSFPERIEQFAMSFSEPKRLRFMVSVDGMPEVHDANRGKAVSFRKATESVVRLVSLRSRGLDVSVNHTVISNRSLEEAPRIQRLFRDIGVEVQSVLAYEDSAMYGAERRGGRADDLLGGKGYPLHRSLCMSAALEFVRSELGRLHEIRDPVLKWGKRYYLSGLERRLAGVDSPKPKPRCVALRSHLRLLPDGNVPVCQFNTEVIGNLLRDDFDRVWHSVAARENRKWVDACKGCWAECEVMPNAIYSGDILRPM